MCRFQCYMLKDLYGLKVSLLGKLDTTIYYIERFFLFYCVLVSLYRKPLENILTIDEN